MPSSKPRQGNSRSIPRLPSTIISCHTPHGVPCLSPIARQANVNGELIDLPPALVEMMHQQKATEDARIHASYVARIATMEARVLELRQEETPLSPATTSPGLPSPQLEAPEAVEEPEKAPPLMEDPAGETPRRPSPVADPLPSPCPPEPWGGTHSTLYSPNRVTSDPAPAAAKPGPGWRAGGYGVRRNEYAYAGRTPTPETDFHPRSPHRKASPRKFPVSTWKSVPKERIKGPPAGGEKKKPKEKAELAIDPRVRLLKRLRNRLKTWLSGAHLRAYHLLAVWSDNTIDELERRQIMIRNEQAIMRYRPLEP